MKKPIDQRVKTTMEQFEALHAANAKTRSTSKTVTVSKEALTNILMDHSMMVGELEGR
ncbi:hypothetical protein [Taklimakanibacter albus]|uniref:Uncharacterized protein n=1 Tax=Taklimakanibacter albus TaxID=2800327 RepID=A0ACC5RG58_9HYPH|nr:hypothetical protein [Aestuariivirga sp. YIM B02566]MBK1871592.1 hypothetical protein [Aestuariivirga sp. YIM B02566]